MALGRPPHQRLELFFHPRFAFIRNYLLRGGFRDGAAGLLISRMNAYYVFLKLAKLWELQDRRGDKADRDDEQEIVANTRMAPTSRLPRPPGRMAFIMARLAEPHLQADFGHRGLGDRAGALGAVREDPIDPVGSAISSRYRSRASA